MAAKKTTKTNGSSTEKKKGNKTNKGNGTGQTKKSATKKPPKMKSASATKLPKEELVPELSNELILLVTLVVSLLLFLSNFSLSGKVGELINRVTFGLFGVFAYLIPFFLFFGIAFYLANKNANKRYIVKLVTSFGLFTVIAAIIQLVFGETANVQFLDYYKLCAENRSGGGLLGGTLCFLLVPLFGKVGS